MQATRFLEAKIQIWIQCRTQVEKRKGGDRIILPSTFACIPRNMHQNYQDAMAICRAIGKPRWPEILDALLPGQAALDRPDITARVFKAKLVALMRDVLNDGALGRVVGHMHVIEYQKRGLPHAHLLVILHEDDKLVTPDDVDAVICAELPDREAEPELFETISALGLHSPCGTDRPTAPCMKDGNCDKLVQGLPCS